MILKVPSETTKGKFYFVDVIHSTCTCPAFLKAHRECKHIKYVHEMNDAGTLSLEKATKEEYDQLFGAMSHDKARFNMATSDGQAMYDLMESFSLTRLSKNFIMRDFLHTNYNSVAGVCNYPEKPEVVLAAGKALCENILEPIIEKFGKIFITFGYQSRAGIEMADSKIKTKPKGSSPHQWDRGTYGNKIYCRVDVLPACVQDGLVSKKEFRDWIFHNLNLDLIMSWGKSNVFCLTYSEFKPRRVAIEWVQSGTGEGGSNKITYYGEQYWMSKFAKLPKEQRPKFSPSMSDGKMWHEY